MSTGDEIYLANMKTDCDEDRDLLQSQVFFVPKFEKGEDLSKPPMTGEQYLKRVVAETKRCEGVVVKKVKVKPQKNIGQQVVYFPVKDCNTELLMDIKDQVKTVADFSKLRLVLEAQKQKMVHAELKAIRKIMPRKYDEAGWQAVLLNEKKIKVNDLVIPTMTLCLILTQPRIIGVLELIEDWLREGKMSVACLCQWVYSLLACLEIPLEPDVHATLRAIARALIDRRSQLKVESEELPHINVVICIIGRYFQQKDLADPSV